MTSGRVPAGRSRFLAWPLLVNLLVAAAFLLAPMSMAHEHQAARPASMAAALHCADVVHAVPAERTHQNPSSCALACSVIPPDHGHAVASAPATSNLALAVPHDALAGAEEQDPTSPPPRAA
jgi:hypothetical protein